MDSQAECAHCKVEAKHLDHPDGTRSEYWECTSGCGCRFAPLPLARRGDNPPSPKPGWDHSEQVLVCYAPRPELDRTARYSIAYYHTKPPYRDKPEWVDFGVQREAPAFWWPLPMVPACQHEFDAEDLPCAYCGKSAQELGLVIDDVVDKTDKCTCGEFKDNFVTADIHEDACPRSEGYPHDKPVSTDEDALLAKLNRHIMQMAPHQRERAGGLLLIAARDALAHQQ